MNREGERLINGIVKENPTFVLMLGMCPTLAVTTSAMNGLGMGLTTMVVLALSNAIISLLRNIIPDRVRIPAFIVIIASFVTIMQFLLEGFIPSLYSSLGLYIPLIVVNCIILGRAESYASKNPVLPLLTISYSSSELATPSSMEALVMASSTVLALNSLNSTSSFLHYYRCIFELH